MGKLFRIALTIVMMLGLAVFPAFPSQAADGPVQSQVIQPPSGDGKAGIRALDGALRIDAQYFDPVDGKIHTDLAILAIAPDSTTASNDSYDIPKPPAAFAPLMYTYMAIVADKLTLDARPVMASTASSPWSLKMKADSGGDIPDPYTITLYLMGTTSGWSYSGTPYNQVPASVSWLLLVDGSTITNIWTHATYAYTQSVDGATKTMSVYAKANAPPTVNLTSFTSGGIYKATQTLTALASDADTVSPYNDVVQTDFYYSSLGSAPWSFIGTSLALSASITWSTAVAPDATSYKIRSFATDSKGGTSESISPAYFTVDNTPPSPPVPMNPASNLYTNQTTPTFIWSAAFDTTTTVTYQLQADNSGATYPSPEVNVSGIVATGYSSGILTEGDYTWHVRAIDAAGNTGAWSFDSVFHIDTTPPGVVPLTSPASGAYVATASPTFTWSVVGDPSPPLSYNLFISANSNLSSATVTKTSLSVPIYSLTSGESLAQGAWYWGVSATDGAGNTGAMSLIRPFIVDTVAPAAPTLLTPASAAQLTSFTVPLDWSDVADSSGVKYKLKVSTNQSFAVLLIATSGLLTSDYTITSGLSALTTYYWTAGATDGAGNEGSYATPAFSFMVAKVTETAAWQAGWVMFGLDLNPSPQDFNSQLGDNIAGTIYVFHYNPNTGIYDIVSTGGVASGYWTKIVTPVTMDVAGFPLSTATTGYQLDLGNGWNQIASPWKSDVFGVNVTVKNGGVTKSILDANAAGWLSRYVYSYNTSTGIYEFQDAATTGVMHPLVGYWVKSNIGGNQLIIPPP